MPARNFIPRFLTVSKDPASPFAKTINWLQDNYNNQRVIITYEIIGTIDPNDLQYFDHPTTVTDPVGPSIYQIGFGATKTKGKPGDPNGLT